MWIKPLVIVYLGVLFVGCSQTNSFIYNKSDKNLNILVNNDYKKLEFTNPTFKKFNSRRCLNDRFIIDDLNHKYGKLHIDFIAIDKHCYWTDSYSLFYFNRLKKLYNATNVVFIDKEKINDYEFLNYQVNAKKIKVIRYYTANEIGFIVDEDNKFSDELKLLLMKK